LIIVNLLGRLEHGYTENHFITGRDAGKCFFMPGLNPGLKPGLSPGCRVTAPGRPGLTGHFGEKRRKFKKLCDSGV